MNTRLPLNGVMPRKGWVSREFASVIEAIYFAQRATDSHGLAIAGEWSPTRDTTPCLVCKDYGIHLHADGTCTLEIDASFIKD